MNDEGSKEKRLTDSVDLEAPVKDTDLKEDEARQDKVISGYALKFNTPSKDLRGFVEIITPEALEKTDLSDVCCLIEHDFTQILERTKSGSLEVEVDEIGLKFKCTLPDTSYANDVYENTKKGNIDSMSFGFTIPNDGDIFQKKGDKVVRTVKNIKSLFDVSVKYTRLRWFQCNRR